MQRFSGEFIRSNLSFRISELHSKSLEVCEFEEGDEVEAFWDSLGDEEDYMSYIEGTIYFKENLCAGCVSYHYYY